VGTNGNNHSTDLPLCRAFHRHETLSVGVQRHLAVRVPQ